MSENIQFRPGDTLRIELAARSAETSPSLTARRDLERYYALLAETPRDAITDDERAVLHQALARDGAMMASIRDPRSARMLLRMAAEELGDSDLLRRVSQWTPAEVMAVLDMLDQEVSDE